MGVWVATNAHLQESQKVGMVLMALKGAPRTIGLDLFKMEPKLTLSALTKKLRTHFIPDEMAHTIEKTTALYQCEKGRSLASFSTGSKK